MPLTHVRVWDDRKGYRRVTVEEASLMFPHETVSASRGYFVCELCAQNVCFTAPGIYSRHFRHDSAAQNKECEERQTAYSASPTALNCQSLPIRIRVYDDKFTLQLGFVHPAVRRSQSSCSTIKICGDFYHRLNFSFDRIEASGITYLDIGNCPCQEYKLAYEQASPELTRFWPASTPGVNPAGSFFDCSTNKMLPIGAKAFLGKKYYLLQRIPLRSLVVPHGITARKITEIRTPNLENWSLFQLEVTSFSEPVARFFLQRSIFLAEKPTVFYPIWPPYVEDPYFIYHRENDLYFYMQGENAELKTFPVTRTSQEAISRNVDSGKLYHIFASSKEQLLSLGRSGALGFTYLMKKEMDLQAPKPVVSVIDLEGTAYDAETYTQLPKSKRLTIFAPFDGKVVFRKNGKINFIYRLTAEQDLMVDQIAFGTQIEIIQGCDLVRSLCFERKTAEFDVAAADKQLATKLKSARGAMITIPHSFGTIAAKMQDYPQTKQWLLQAIRSGEIPRSAYRMLIRYSQEMNNET